MRKQDGGCMKHYFAHEKAPNMAFTPDAEFPVIHGEKGIIIFDLVKDLNLEDQEDIVLKSIKGGNAPNMVPDYCEAIIETENISEVEEKLNKFVEEKIIP